jgi:hypothetical protein
MEDSMPSAHQLQKWATREIEIWTGPVSAGKAAVEAALPLVAVVVGMLAFAVIVHFATH